MKRLLFVLLILAMTLGAFSSIFVVWAGGVVPPIGGGITDSERFVNVLEKENVDTTAWIHGHIHSEHHMNDVEVYKWGTYFLDDGSVMDKPESIFLIFENGENKVIVKSRNHKKGKWNHLENQLSFYLDYPFKPPSNWKKDNLIIWVFSDIQPVKEKNWKNLKKSIEDVNNLKIQPDMSLVLGDIVDHGTSKAYKRFKKYLENSKLPIDNFYELAGNHDFYPYFTGNHKNYRKYIENKLKYTKTRGNLLFIFMSDEKPGATGVIKDNTFQWWKQTVQNNQTNTNIISLAHHPLEGTTRGAKTSVIDYLYGNLYLILPSLIPIGMSVIIAYEVS